MVSYCQKTAIFSLLFKMSGKSCTIVFSLSVCRYRVPSIPESCPSSAHCVYMTSEPMQKISSGFLFSCSIASQGIFLLFPSFFIVSIFLSLSLSCSFTTFFSYFPFFSLPFSQYRNVSVIYFHYFAIFLSFSSLYFSSFLVNQLCY